MNRPARQTLATAPTSAAPLQILLYTLPLWSGAALLTLFMPLTGILSTVVASLCLLLLPFRARRGHCPQCGTPKLFPFSGFGNACKGCGEELVLRGYELHLIEPKPREPRPPYSGRRAR